MLKIDTYKVWQPGRDPGDWWWNRRRKWVVTEKIDAFWFFWSKRNSEPFSYEEAKYLLVKLRQSGSTTDNGDKKPDDWFAMLPVDKDDVFPGNGISVKEMYEKYGYPE